MIQYSDRRFLFSHLTQNEIKWIDLYAAGCSPQIAFIRAYLGNMLEAYFCSVGSTISIPASKFLLSEAKEGKIEARLTFYITVQGVFIT